MAAQGLAWLAQEDFAAGAVRSVARHLIPASGVYAIENGLLDDDGSIYRRGGSEYLSDAVFSAGGLRWVWDGHLAAGQRTVFASPTTFGVLDDVTPVDLGGSGLAGPVRAVVVAGMLFIPGGTIYGGSLKAADYAAGTVSVTQGSSLVNGAGTAFLANVDAGMLLRIAGAGRYYVVASVDSDGQITLADAYEGATAAGQAYALTRLGSASSPYRSADVYASVAERLVTVEGAQVRFSAGRSELGVLQPHSFAATDLHALPEGARGLGAEAIRDLLVVFATDGVWTINNMTFDLTDAAGNVQQSMQRTSQDVVLWGPAGVSAYRGALVVPAVDGVYLVDGASQPLPVSDSITPLLVEHVRSGRKPGGAAVFKGHYFLPVLDEANIVVDLLVCRLDRPVKSRNRTFFPWSWFRGHAGDVAAVAQQVSDGSARQPELLAAGADGRVLRLSGVFEPVASRAMDADESVHRWRVESRDFATGRGNVNTMRRARARYEMTAEERTTANLLVNGGFEDGLAPWFASSAVPGVSLAGLTRAALLRPDGTVLHAPLSVRYRAVTEVDGLHTVTQTIPVTVGQRLRFGFHREIQEADPGAECVARVYFLDAAASLVGSSTFAGGPAVAGVIDSPSGEVVVPPDAVESRLEARWNAVGTGGIIDAFVDDLWYVVVAPGPVIRGYRSVGADAGSGDRWGSFAWGDGRWGDASLAEFVQMEGVAPEDTGRGRHTWHHHASARYVRLRLESTDPAAKLVLRSMEVAIRPSAKDR